MSISIVALAVLMAGLLVVQGLRADRNAQFVLERQHELEAQSRAYSELSSSAALFDTAQTAADIFTDTTVMALRFTDSISLAERVADSESITTVDHLVGYLEELAASQGIEPDRSLGYPRAGGVLARLMLMLRGPQLFIQSIR